jgi:hypothetical protein
MAVDVDPPAAAGSDSLPLLLLLLLLLFALLVRFDRLRSMRFVPTSDSAALSTCMKHKHTKHTHETRTRTGPYPNRVNAYHKRHRHPSLETLSQNLSLSASFCLSIQHAQI